MYGSSLHVEVFCLAQPGSVNLSLDFATSLARSSFARCAVVMLGLQTDSPSQRQPRLANAEASTGGTLASPQFVNRALHAHVGCDRRRALARQSVYDAETQ